MAKIALVQTSRVAEEAGRRLSAAITRIRNQRGFVRLAIPGGSALVALEHARYHLGRDDWEGLHLTWIDERCVPFSHGASNRGEAYRSGVLDTSDPAGLELPLFLDDEQPKEACARVHSVLQASFGGALDVALLGMGEDGHIASLFPGHDWAPGPALVQVVEDSPKPPSLRITLSLSLLASVPESILVVSGEAKRWALQRLLQGDSTLPGSALPNLTVITDLDVPRG